MHDDVGGKRTERDGQQIQGIEGAVEKESIGSMENRYRLEPGRCEMRKLSSDG